MSMLELESNVRAYCRTFPDIFHTSKGSMIYSEDRKEYLDFFSGAGALNYGHNNEYIKEKLLRYLASDRIIHSLDMNTTTKREFLEKLSISILKPRNLNYKVQFCGPTGTNAVEAALKLARKAKKRQGIFSFMGGFHGMSLGSLSVSSNASSRKGAGVALPYVTFMPFPYKKMYSFDTLEYLETVLQDSHSGIEAPAAIILETIQAEGGVIPAPLQWIRNLREICDKHDILLICDEIQIGCGRTGPFFSFERAGIVPDIVVLSKSISGYGLPLSLLLMKEELDLWEPAEHTGTFRSNQLALVGAMAALEYRETANLENEVADKGIFMEEMLKNEIGILSDKIEIRGAGLIWGIDLSGICNSKSVEFIAKTCFNEGLIIERAGRDDTVLKVLPPLTISKQQLEQGCNIIKNAVEKSTQCL